MGTPRRKLDEILGAPETGTPTPSENQELQRRPSLDDLLRPSLDEIFGEPEPGGGGVGAFFRTLGSVIKATGGAPGYQGIAGKLFGPPAAEDFARSALFGAGAVEGAVVNPVQAVLEIPGMFTNQEIFTDRMIDYIQRKQHDLVTPLERQASLLGIQEGDIAMAAGMGEFFGTTAPMLGAVKISNFVFKGPDTVAKWFTWSNMLKDSFAGAIYGGLLHPNEDAMSRLKAIGKEAAAFGVGRVILDGGIFALMGRRGRTIQRFRADENVQKAIKAMENGERPVLTAEQSEAVMLILNEENFIASSPIAHELLKLYQDERALVQGIKDAAELGIEGGIVRNIGSKWPYVVKTLDKLKEQFPKYVFQPYRVKGREGYTVYFGPKGLSSNQIAHLKEHGRVPGQIVRKNNASYEYVRPSKKPGYIVVKRSGKDGTTRLKVDGKLTDTFGWIPEIQDTPVMEGLYQRFIQDIFKAMKDHDDLGGGLLPEYELIRMIREGELEVSSLFRRDMLMEGAIIYPEEIGLAGFDEGEIFRAILQEGYRGGGLLPAPRLVSFEEAVELWARSNKIPADKIDFDAMKHFFGRRAREDFWKLIPEEDMKVLDFVRDEFHRLSEAGDIPLEALAHNKGFVLAEAGNVWTLRDINSGFRISFGSRAMVEEALVNFVRHEKDMLSGGLLPHHTHGIGAMTGGFDATDGYFAFEGEVPLIEYLHDLPELPPHALRNRASVMQDVELRSGIPFFTKIVDKLNKGFAALRHEQEPWAREIEDIWKGLKRGDRKKVFAFWSEVEGSNLTRSQAISLAKQQGLSPRQIDAWDRATKVFDTWFEMTSLPRERYINWYYTRVRPVTIANGGAIPDTEWDRLLAATPPAFRWWALKTRRGELSVIADDPKEVMHRYIRGLLFEKHVQPHYEPARALVREKTTPKVRDLPPDTQRAYLQANPHMKPQSNLIPDEVIVYMREYLTLLRGIPPKTQGTIRSFMSKLFRYMGVDVKERVLEEYVNIGITNFYGAAMGLRYALLARNATQNLWNTYTRLGSEFGTQAFEMGMSIKGFEEVFDEGVIRAVSGGGLPNWDVFFNNMMESAPIRGSGVVGQALESSLRFGLRAGKVTNEMSKKFLIPYSYVDDSNRAVAYFWQKLHTEKWLNKFEAGKIKWNKVIEEGLPFFHPVVKRDFARHYNKLGKEAALRYIGRQAADETQFIYGLAMSPSLFQSPLGRAFGTFGTWPLWSAEIWLRRITYGTPKQRAKFIARNLVMIGAFANMHIQTGVNLFNWMASFSWLGWTGGPGLDYGMQMFDVVSAPMDQKAVRLQNLAKNMGRLVFPGQVLVQGDIMTALDQEDPMMAGFSLLLGRPLKDSSWNIEYMHPYEESYDTPFTRRPPEVDIDWLKNVKPRGRR